MDNKQKKKKAFKLPTAYTVLLIITAVIAIVTHFIAGVRPAGLSDFVMAPINGLNDSIDIAIFVLLIGGFLGITTKTGALDAGIGSVVSKLKGKELILIPVLMFLFSLGGTSFGMAEETIAFTALVTTTMIIAGFDPLVSVATIILGSGCGVLGSTVNPFLVSVSIGSLNGAGIPVNQGVVIATNTVLWIVSLLISIYFVMSYAKKVYNDKNQSIELFINSEGYYFHDKKWIAESLSNIIKNAIEHTSINGKIKIILEETPMSISITISDNGEGIDEDEVKNIFKRFYKGKNSINPKSVGIGLSLSKKIIEAHGGSISVKSKLEKGTIFNIIFLKVIV